MIDERVIIGNIAIIGNVTFEGSLRVKGNTRFVNGKPPSENFEKDFIFSTIPEHFSEPCQKDKNGNKIYCNCCCEIAPKFFFGVDGNYCLVCLLEFMEDHLKELKAFSLQKQIQVKK